MPRNEAASFSFFTYSLQRDCGIMEDCTFCKVANGKLPSFKIYDDGRYVAVMDLFPSRRGQTLVIPKRHVDSYIFKMSDKEIADFMVAVKRVARLLERGLGVERVSMIFEGAEVNHLHAKLYPIDVSNYRMGQVYISPPPKGRADDEYLKELMERIKKANG